MAHNTILRGGLLIDGTGAEPVPDSFVQFSDGVIAATGRAAELGNLSEVTGTEIIDIRGRVVMPGLVNCHEHLDLHYSYGSWEERIGQHPMYWVARAARNALLALCDGVTTARDLASRDGNSFAIKKAIEDGLMLGPRVVTAGQPISMTGGHGWQECIQADGADAVRKAARGLLQAGADLIKCMASGDYMVRHGDQPQSPQLGIEEMRAAFDEAHNQGKRTTVHCQPPLAMRNAVQAGTDCVEHGALMDRESAELLARHGVFLVPTLGETFVLAERGERLGKPRWIIDDARANSEQRWESFGFAVDAGVKIGVGTDTCDSMSDEVGLMIKGGMRPMDALVAATRIGAEICGLGDRTGTIEPGKWADLLVLKDNPLNDVHALAQIEVVFKAGVSYAPHQLQAAIGKYPL